MWLFPPYPHRNRRFKSRKDLDERRERLYKFHKELFKRPTFHYWLPKKVKVQWNVEWTEQTILPKRDKKWNIITHFTRKF